MKGLIILAILLSSVTDLRAQENQVEHFLGYTRDTIKEIYKKNPVLDTGVTENKSNIFNPKSHYIVYALKNKITIEFYFGRDNGCIMVIESIPYENQLDGVMKDLDKRYDHVGGGWNWQNKGQTIQISVRRNVYDDGFSIKCFYIE